MSDLLEQNLRDIFSEGATQVDAAASVRLRAIDYHPRRRRRPTLLGVSATAAAVVAVVTLASSAAPVFAGWSPTPTRPAAGQLATAEQACRTSLGTPVLADTRGPYTASIYADATSSHLCLEGGSLSIASSRSGSREADVPAGHIELAGTGMKNSSGQATVSGGWYLAWWSGTARATTADVTTTTGTASEHFPSTPQGPASPRCLVGSHCASGYSFGAARPGSTQNTMGSSRSQ